MQLHLINQGVTFKKVNDVWVAYYAGSEAARHVYRGECIWRAAEALGEV